MLSLVFRTLLPILLFLKALFFPSCHGGENSLSPFNNSNGTSVISVAPNELLLPPGKEAELNITLQSEYDDSSEEVFQILVVNSSWYISIGTTLLHVGYNRLKFFGEVGGLAYLMISSIQHEDLSIPIQLRFSECPPGYYFSSNMTCLCSANSQNPYIGIEYCRLQTFQASLKYGHWAGYVNKDFVTGFCPKGFCVKIDENRLLPSQVPEDHDLSRWVCRQNREGILCAHCITNYSVSFTMYRECHPNMNCHLGWLFYIVSQIVPITILFCVVIAFDVNLMSGSVSGVIFYAQVFDELLLSGIWFGPYNSRMFSGLRLIVEMFNVNFFALESFPFCLWEGAGFLDVIAFRFVTVTYSLLLVFVTVKVALPCFKKLRNFCRRRLVEERIMFQYQIKSSKSIIHGLTSFLVLCYSQTTIVSLYILAHANLYGSRGVRSRDKVFFNGELNFLAKEHLYYVLPASFFLVVVTIVPLLLLLSYPLCYRVLALCRIQESRFTRLLCKAIPLEKYKPLFDSFQGSFKDEHRYFAGLQFLFRFTIIATFAYVRRLTTYYIILEVEFVVILALYAFIQPHKKVWHNRLDSSIIALLAIINACTIYSYHWRTTSHFLVEKIDITTLQVILLYTPLLYLLCFVTWQGVAAIRQKIKMKKESEHELSLRVCNSILESRYSLFKNRVFKNA